MSSCLSVLLFSHPSHHTRTFRAVSSAFSPRAKARRVSTLVSMTTEKRAFFQRARDELPDVAPHILIIACETFGAEGFVHFCQLRCADVRDFECPAAADPGVRDAMVRLIATANRIDGARH